MVLSKNRNIDSVSSTLSGNYGLFVVPWQNGAQVAQGDQSDKAQSTGQSSLLQS